MISDLINNVHFKQERLPANVYVYSFYIPNRQSRIRRELVHSPSFLGMGGMGIFIKSFYLANIDMLIQGNQDKLNQGKFCIHSLKFSGCFSITYGEWLVNNSFV